MGGGLPGAGARHGAHGSRAGSDDGGGRNDRSRRVRGWNKLRVRHLVVLCGQEERWWFEVLSARGSARLAPLRVVKLLNGKPTDVSPSGAAARESVFLQSSRAELAHFIAVVTETTQYEPPDDQLQVIRLMEAIYKAADEGKEVRL